VIVEEGPKTADASAEIAAGIQERFRQHLKASIIRVASLDVPVPVSFILANAYRPNVRQVKKAVALLIGPASKNIPFYNVSHYFE
jgi:pyruvate/2-oxoglutarate/acetoin dehydrogenase E1 component